MTATKDPRVTEQAAIRQGKALYIALRREYPETTDEHFDIILNALCFALICHRSDPVVGVNNIKFNKLVMKILESNP